MRFIPNLLSLSRLPIAVLVLWLSWTGHWKLATLFLLTDALDGTLARRFNVTSGLGGNLLDPVCDGDRQRMDGHCIHRSCRWGMLPQEGARPRTD